MTTTHYPASRDTIAAIVAAARLGLETLRARPPLRLSAWAAEHFVMAGESSHQRGGWLAWPFQVGLMDWMSDDDIEELTVYKAKRIGYTKILTASIGFDAAYRRRNQAVWQPTDDDRDSYVKTEIDPMIEGVRAVADARSQAKAATDTMKFKQFRDSVLHLLGAKAARAFRRITVACAKLDEVDAMDRVIEKTIDPITGARGRLEGAPFPKLICGSTPRHKGLSHVEDRAGEADVQMRFQIACPHCGVEHPLVWGGRRLAYGLRWHDDDPDTAHHVCPHCRAAITQADYLQTFPPPPGSDPEVLAAYDPARQGVWVCTVTGARYDHHTGRWLDAAGVPIKAPRHVAVYPWAAYSPQRAWTDIVKEFLFAEKKQAAGDTGPIQGFVNETLGETYADAAEQGDQHQLMARREGYALRTVPVGCLVLVAFVDVQDNRFHVGVWGFGRGFESWVIDRQVFDANPADERDWLTLDNYLRSRFRQAWHGGSLGIECVGIDTGGHFTHQVYNFCRTREHRRICATKGSSKYGGPIKSPATKQDVNWRGQVIRAGVKLWHVGTDTAKDLLYGRLTVLPAADGGPMPGCIHFSHQLDADFFEQLTAEGRVLQKTSQGEVYRWVKLRPRNEDLDCAVGALWCAEAIDLHRYTDGMWARLEAMVQPAKDLFTVTPERPAEEAPERLHDGPVLSPAEAAQIVSNQRQHRPAAAPAIPRGW